MLVRPKDRVLHEALAGAGAGTLVLDLGAHRGETAAAFAARGAEVHAYEPNPDIFPELEAAARRNPRIRAHNAGVLDCDGEMRLYLHADYAADPAGHSESSSFLAEKANVSAGDSRLVAVRDIAGIVAALDRPVDIVKIDVEGAEYAILERLIETRAIERVGAVYVEAHTDRIPGHVERHEAMLARIRAAGLERKIRFDWA